MSDQLQTQVTTLTQQRADLVSELGNLRGRKQQVSDELILLAETKGRFVAEITAMERELELLSIQKELLRNTTDSDVSELQTRKDSLLTQISALESVLGYVSNIAEGVGSLVVSFEELKSEIDTEYNIARSSQNVLKNHATKLEGIVTRASSELVAKTKEADEVIEKRIEKVAAREAVVRNKEREIRLTR